MYTRPKLIATNYAVRMVSAIHDAAAKQKTSLPVDYKSSLNTVVVSKTPDVFKRTVYLLVQEEGEVLTDFYKKLIKLVNYDESEYYTSLSIAAALMSIVYTSFYQDLKPILAKCGYIIKEITLPTFIDLHPELVPANIDDISMYSKMEASHYVYGLSLLMCVICKKLTSADYPACCSRRQEYFAALVGLRDSDPLLFILTPSLTFSSRIYVEVNVFYKVRHLFMEYIYGMSQKSDLLVIGMKATVTFLKGENNIY